ncbi:amidase [Halopseudomonas phragmitis]|uniref:Amidase domain-containing protein n=1 Tax=Halopseudomonas phragmitis TaxID=1931241 RepID=A0A1V0B9A8_9GAMM|nr:amidase family protein [Halopseudomonas phragmitis]AQZ96523.1 hypothetical protein BVH74_17985 [Halopseudomonas phragmitis]
MTTFSRRDFIAGTALLAAGAAVSTLRAPLSWAGSSGLRFDEYVRFDAMGLAEQVRLGAVSPAELLELAINRTEAVNPQINAVVMEHFELARRQVAAGVGGGAFAGVPFLLKDLGVSMADTVTTQGSRFFKDARARQDDPFVRKVRDAGLVVFGKTHSPEFGNSPNTESSLFGATCNPWNLDYSVGGSSGGAAAAVAAGIVPVAHASDGGGSIRIPASACGLFGLKPSRGLVPIGSGDGEVRGGLSAQHVISRSVRDTAAMLDAFAWSNPGRAFDAHSGEGSYIAQMKREPGKLRIAVMQEPLQDFPVDAECIKAVDQAALLCRELGHRVEEAVPRIDMASAAQASGLMSIVSLAHRVALREAELGRAVTEADLEPANWQMLSWGKQIPALDYARGLDALQQAAREMAEFMQDYDVLLSPTLAQVPPKLGVIDMALPLEQFGAVAGRVAAFTSIFNTTGQPAMSVPLYWTESGLPVGVMFAGRFGEERTLLRLAAQLEQAQPWFTRLPKL